MSTGRSEKEIIFRLGLCTQVCTTWKCSICTPKIVRVIYANFICLARHTLEWYSTTAKAHQAPCSSSYPTLSPVQSRPCDDCNFNGRTAANPKIWIPTDRFSFYYCHYYYLYRWNLHVKGDTVICSHVVVVGSVVGVCEGVPIIG